MIEYRSNSGRRQTNSYNSQNIPKIHACVSYMATPPQNMEIKKTRKKSRIRIDSNRSCGQKNRSFQRIRISISLKTAFFKTTHVLQFYHTTQKLPKLTNRLHSHYSLHRLQIYIHKMTKSENLLDSKAKQTQKRKNHA